MSRQAKKPAYQLHKGTGQAKCRIGGKDFYRGLYCSPQSLAKYNELVSAWLTKRNHDRGQNNVRADSAASAASNRAKPSIHRGHEKEVVEQYPRTAGDDDSGL